MIRSIALFLAFILFFQPALIYAQDVPDAEIAIIKRAGAPAPFEGVLYSNKVFAQEKAKRELLEESFQLKLKYELGIQESKLGAKIEIAEAVLKIEQNKHKEIVDAKNQRISNLEQDLVKADEKANSTLGENLLWAGGGALAVVLGALAVAAIAGAFSPDVSQ